MSMFHRTASRFPLFRLLSIAGAAALSAGLVFARAPAKSPALPPILPPDFAGWHLASPATLAAAPEAADAANADLLKEDGFTEFSTATYTRGGDKLSVRAIGFGDASGAYAAYTYYRRPGLPKQEVGYGGVFDGSHVLFWQGATVVDATFDHLTGMSAAELRELAASLPRILGGSGVPPPLPGYLPQAGLDPQSTRYALGPIGYLRGGGVLPPSLVDFGRGAEVITAQYADGPNSGYLTLIDYPTPQLAADRLRALATFLAAGNTPAAQWSTQLAQTPPAALQSRRSGPLVAMTSGSFSAGAARKVLSDVHYSADVTWNHPQGYVSEVSKTARLFVGIVTLSAFLAGVALLLAIFFGGGRALYRRLRGKPASTVADAEFISLHLRE
jgi:hypothetical protein